MRIGLSISLDLYDYAMLPENPATKAARALMNRFSIPRVEREDAGYEPELQDYIQCTPCTRRGNRTKYSRENMKKISYVCKNGKKVNAWYCPACYKKYTPQEFRVGNQSY